MELAVHPVSNGGGGTVMDSLSLDFCSALFVMCFFSLIYSWVVKVCSVLTDWSFFLQYFTSRLKDSSLVSSSANETKAGEQRSALEAKFNNVMTLCAMLPLLICTCLTSFLHSL